MAKKKKKKKTPPPKKPEITAQVLQVRKAAMTQQQARVMQDAAKLQGAIQFCGDLMKILEGTAPMARPGSELPTQADVERMRAEAIASVEAIEKQKKLKARRTRAKAKRETKTPTTE